MFLDKLGWFLGRQLYNLHVYWIKSQFIRITFCFILLMIVGTTSIYIVFIIKHLLHPNNIQPTTAMIVNPKPIPATPSNSSPNTAFYVKFSADLHINPVTIAITYPTVRDGTQTVVMETKTILAESFVNIDLSSAENVQIKIGSQKNKYTYNITAYQILQITTNEHQKLNGIYIYYNLFPTADNPITVHVFFSTATNKQFYELANPSIMPVIPLVRQRFVRIDYSMDNGSHQWSWLAGQKYQFYYINPQGMEVHSSIRLLSGKNHKTIRVSINNEPHVPLLHFLFTNISKDIRLAGLIANSELLVKGLRQRFVAPPLGFPYEKGFTIYPWPEWNFAFAINHHDQNDKMMYLDLKLDDLNPNVVYTFRLTHAMGISETFYYFYAYFYIQTNKVLEF